MTLLSVENLKVHYPTRTGLVEAVRGVSFTLGRERLFLARLRREGGQLRDDVREVIPIAHRVRHLLARALQRIGRAPPCLVRAGDGGAVAAAEGVEQGAVASRVDKTAIVMLTVNLDQQAANLAQQRGRAGLIVEEGAAAAVRLHHAADDERLARFQHHARVGGKGAETGGGVAVRLESRGDAGLRLSATDKAAVGARAERKTQRVEQDGLTRAGLAGQHAQPRLEREVKRLDQHDVADGQGGQHRADLFMTPARTSP